MADYLHIPCPNCKHTLRVRRQYIGIEVTCQRCDQSFVVEAPPEDNESTQGAPTAANHEECEKRIASLQAELEELRKTHADSVAAHEAMSDELAKLNEERSAHILKLTSSLSDAEDNLRRSKDQAQEHVAVLGEELQRSKDRIEQLTNGASTLQAELDQLRKSQDDSAADRESMDSELVRLNEERSAHIVQLTNSLSDAEDMLRRSKDQDQEQVTVLGEELQRSKDRIEQLTNDASKLQAELGQLRRSHDDSAADRESTDSELVRLNEERSAHILRLTQSVAAAEEKLQRSEERNKQRTGDISKLVAARDQAQERLEALEEKLRTLPAQGASASAGSPPPAADGRIEKLEEQLQQAHSELNAMRELIGGLGISIG